MAVPLRRVAVLAPFILLGATRPAAAWTWKGHTMTTEAAARALPPDVPAFLRDAVFELGSLANEPDRWRDLKQHPSLWGLGNFDHFVKLETLPAGPLPTSRYVFFLNFARSQKDNDALTLAAQSGFALYAIAENAELMATEFALWRAARTKTPREAAAKRQLEQSIIRTAGILSHYVSDLAMPMHTSIHIDGWMPNVPNPKKHKGTDLHHRFETVFIEKALETRDFEPLLQPARLRGAWLDAGLEHARESHAVLEELFALDETAKFGSGKETPAHKRFAAERLAHATQALRDFWYSAWIKSEALAAKP